MDCYITRTGSFLPGQPVENGDISKFLGRLPGESRIRQKILRVNGIKQRYYALDEHQRASHSVYELAACAVEACLGNPVPEDPVSYLSAGSTNTPHVGPGISSLLHSQLKERNVLTHSLEINSCAGICSSGAQAFVNACRAVKTGEHRAALCVGVEQPSEILKSSVIRPTYDILTMMRDVQKSKWFMSVFLRSMLSDGAGAFLLQNKPGETGPSFAVNWTYSQSFANEAPLCMKLESRNLLLSQDVRVLSSYMMPCAKKALAGALSRHGERLDEYRAILPHLSSQFFQRPMIKALKELSNGDGKPVEHWTNLATAGNTGAASIFIMFDEYARTRELKDGDRVLLFIPESGQFNFVVISLSVVS